ncbi:MAG: hypothetical protein WKF37_10440 [Bryobacteraceae bacterium]
MLGWLNASHTLQIATGNDGHEILHSLVSNVMEAIETTKIEVAHLKIALQDEQGSILRVQVTRNEEKPAFVGALSGRVHDGELLINLRAEADPENLEKVITDAFTSVLTGVAYDITKFAAFKPGQPVPTHRVLSLH